jgi:futalosine hydrolase
MLCTGQEKHARKNFRKGTIHPSKIGQRNRLLLNADICGMHILLVAATEQELAPCQEMYSDPAAVPAGMGLGFCVTGVGSVPTAYRLADRFHQKRPDLAIQAGIAGCFSEIPTGTVMAVSSDAFADLGVWEAGRFRSLFDLGLENPGAFPFRDGCLVNPWKSLLGLTELPLARSITVNEISTGKDRIHAFKERFNPVLESMEGAAYHYVCLQEKIPFVQIRAVSNAIGERDKTKWSMPRAIESLNAELVRLLPILAQYQAHADEHSARVQPLS